ncbi:DNA cytosine methyltransferase [Paraglaciecola chathamensis]|uniref:DNA (cytosine-5-)-methyltransferase n=1 Tax=Paraglaciecola chathamensis S18K6 TaxID=1127672 RepID=A0AAV3V542_9ALTE|nr:DNA cytosine methyltransferase [Paraglaciecola chathamensis]GAC11825.1 DNA (cytosine-5-)-methyltransferase [Paraglaciecola chathamensis S18K6]
MTSFETVDLFSGVGGLSYGFEKAGFISKYAVEFNSSIAKGYEENFPHSKIINEDINTVNIKSVFGNLNGDKTIIIGGPPCQGFSQKGKRIGLNDERNFLFLKYIECVEVINPIAFVIENVPGLLTNEGGFFLNEIIEKLQGLGYSLFERVLNASDYGVPQNRKRAFIVGLRTENATFTWPTEFGKKVTINDAISDLPILKSGEGSKSAGYRTAPVSDYQVKMRGTVSKVLNHVSTKHSPLVLERLKLIPEDGGRTDLPPEHLTKSTFSGTWCRLPANGIARTITTRFDTPSSGMFTLPRQDRCLTVREAARIQSFPDSFRFPGGKSTQMLQVGNAVPPLLAEAVGKQLMKSLLKMA